METTAAETSETQEKTSSASTNYVSDAPGTLTEWTFE